MKNNKIFAAFVIVTVILTGCAQTDFDPIPVENLMGEKWESTTTIADLKANYMTSTGLFFADLISDREDVIINGIVTSTDVEGNVYKYIVVQEEEGTNPQAIKISIDAGSLSGFYPLGQRVSVRCNDLYIGKYAQGPQIGVYFENTEKNRVEPGRMPKPISDLAISAYDMPDPAAVIADTMTIAEIKAAGELVFNKLICIKNAYFTGKGSNYGEVGTIPDAEKIFAPSTGGIGYPQSREITDGTGSVFISTSEYAKFATKALPAASYKGNITAIIGWYNDKDVTLSSSKVYHQLTLRSLDDLGKGFEGYHNEE